MGHGHGTTTTGTATDRQRGRTARLAWCWGSRGAFAVAEVVGGLVAGSLALLADAAHMVSDVASLALALGAIWLAGRPASSRMSFGYRRAEILAALANGVGLVAVSDLDHGRGGPAARLTHRRRRAAVTLAIGLAGLAVNAVGA